MRGPQLLLAFINKIRGYWGYRGPLRECSFGLFLQFHHLHVPILELAALCLGVSCLVTLNLGTPRARVRGGVASAIGSLDQPSLANDACAKFSAR